MDINQFANVMRYTDLNLVEEINKIGNNKFCIINDEVTEFLDRCANEGVFFDWKKKAKYTDFICAYEAIKQHIHSKVFDFEFFLSKLKSHEIISVTWKKNEQSISIINENGIEIN